MEAQGVDGRKSSIIKDGSGGRKKSIRFSFSGVSSRRNSRRKPTLVIAEEDSFILFNKLTVICRDNCQYFASDSSELGKRFFEQFESIINHLTVARRYVSEFNRFMHEYDFDDQTPGNGYRSLVSAMHSAINYCLKICKYVAKNRGFLLFRRSVYIQ